MKTTTQLNLLLTILSICIGAAESPERGDSYIRKRERFASKRSCLL